MSKLVELQQQLESTQNSMNYHTRHGGSKSDEVYKEWEIKEAAILAQMDAAKREEANSAIAEDVMTSDQPYILTVNGDDINFRDYITNEHYYQLVAIAVRQKIDEIEYGFNAKLTDQSQRFDQERQQYRDQIEAADKAADEKYNVLYEQFHQIKLEKEELERKLQSAGNEIDQLKTENAELKTKQTEPPKPSNINSSALKEAMAAAQAAKPAIYDVRELDHLGKRIGAYLLENDEYIEFGYLEKGRYRVVDAAEVERFRSERAETNPMEEASPNDTTLVVPPALSFQDDTVQEHTMDGEVDEEATGHNSGTVTREEFEALKYRVECLELEKLRVA